MGSDGKLSGKIAKSWWQRFLNVGFVTGILLILLTCTVISQQSQRIGTIVNSTDDVAALASRPSGIPTKKRVRIDVLMISARGQRRGEGGDDEACRGHLW